MSSPFTPWIDPLKRLWHRLRALPAWSRDRWRRHHLVKQGNRYSNRSFETLRLQLEVRGKHNRIAIGQGVRGQLKIFLQGEYCEVTIGDRVGFWQHTFIHVSSHHCAVHIGSDTTTQGSTFYCCEPHTRIAIGEHCLLAKNTYFWCTDFHSILDAQTRQRINYARHITLGDRVWLGWDVKVLKNVAIGSDAIVGTSSVVAKDIPAGVVAAGIPAKPIRENVTWDIRLLPAADLPDSPSPSGEP